MKSAAFNRRRFLKASGVALALPLLESTTFAVTAAPKRMVNICGTLGFYADSWFPKTTGIEYEPSEYLKHIDEYREHYTLFSGLGHKNQTGRQAHNSEITWLTSAEHPGLDGFVNTQSLDQVAADHLGYVTRYPSIVVSTNVAQSQSYTKGGVMVPAETSPSRLFSKLFLQGDKASVQRETQRLTDGGSILDHLQSETSTLIPNVSSSDRHKLEAYYESLREAERELVSVKAWHNRPKPSIDQEPPTDIGSSADLIGRIRAMLKLVPLILESDSSRVVSLMIQDHGAVTTGIAGVDTDQHSLSHHGQDAAKIVQLRKVENAIMVTFKELLAALTHKHGDDSRLIDTTTVLYGSNLGNANSHSAVDLPILVAGGPLPHGKHHAYEGETNEPLSNLFVTLLRTLDMEIDSFGHSTSALTWS